MKDEKTLAEVGVPWPSWLPKPTHAERITHDSISIMDGDTMSYDYEKQLVIVKRKDGSVETLPFEIEIFK